MRKLLYILFMVLCCISAMAQSSDHYFQDKNYKYIMGIDMNYEFSSNSITNKFLDKYLAGDYIDNNNKQWMFANLKSHNRFGADLEGGLSFVTLPDTFAGVSNLGLFVKLNKYYHVDMSFTDDLMELFFDGNKRFAGKTADLSNSSLNIISYDQLQLGVLTKFGNDKITHTFGMGLSVNNGYKNNDIEIKNGSLYTEQNGEYIDFSANYEVFRSDTSNKGNNAFKGTGTSLNLYYSFETDKKNIFDFQITNIGFIRWVRHSQHFSRDTAIHFEGIQVSDILNIEGNIFDRANSDSIVHAYTFADTTTAYTMFTPVCLKISYLYHISEKVRTELSIKKKFFSHYDPFIMLKAQYLPDKRNILSLNLSYGGYSGFNFIKNHTINTGIEFAHDFGKGMLVLFGTNYLDGFIFPYSASSQGAFFTLKKYFF